MAQSAPAIPPAGTPFVNADGRVTTAWYAYLQQFALFATSALATDTRIAQAVSYTTGGAITATAASGATVATVNVAASERIYLDVPAVAVTAGSAPAPLATLVYVYYDDPKRAGGAVTYATTTDPNMAATSDANPGRVYVGSVMTPNAGGSATTGAGPTPPGHGGGGATP